MTCKKKKKILILCQQPIAGWSWLVVFGLQFMKTPPGESGMGESILGRLAWLLLLEVKSVQLTRADRTTNRHVVSYLP